jgi:arylsulfatase A-like enzyme
MRRLLGWVVLAAALALAVYAIGTRLGGVEEVRTDPLAAGELEGANLIICVVDAARADHVGAYGYERDTTPHLDRLARESFLFERHFVEFPRTHESTAALFTSLHTDTHLVRTYGGLAESTFTMAKGLAEAGYSTVTLSANTWTTREAGVGQHFDEHCDPLHLGPFKEGSETVLSPLPLLRAFEAWLHQREEGPFFAYLHFVPPHQPYTHPEEMRAAFQGKEPPEYRPEDYHPGFYEHPVKDNKRSWDPPPMPEWINLYDSHLKYADWTVGELLRLLRHTDLLDNTVLVITSDHGEAFGEHGYLWHVFGAYDEVTHIPLVVRLPGRREPRRVPALTQNTDLLPTLFELLNVPYPKEEIHGRSLLPLMTGEAERVHDEIFIAGDGAPQMYVVRSRDYMLVLYANGKWRSLYDLRDDPGQRENIIADRPKVAAEMVEAFRRFTSTQLRQRFDVLDPEAEPVLLTDRIPQLQEAARGARPRELSPEAKQQLRDLGYLE